jgi:hypothetical protein
MYVQFGDTSAQGLRACVHMYMKYIQNFYLMEHTRNVVRSLLIGGMVIHFLRDLFLELNCFLMYASKY